MLISIPIHLVIIYLYILIRTYRINRLTFSDRACRERIELMMTTWTVENHPSKGTLFFFPFVNYINFNHSKAHLLTISSSQYITSGTSLYV